MYPTLLQTHSIIRFLVLILLIIVIINSILGFTGKKPFGKADNILGLTLFSATHTQLLLGILLYFVSPFVQFGGGAMKDPAIRYWTTEHGVIMIIAIVLITLARTTTKKMKDDASKHKRMFVFNGMALIIILLGIAMTQRGFFSMSGMSAQ